MAWEKTRIIPASPAELARAYRDQARLFADRIVVNLRAEAAAIEKAIDVAFGNDRLITAGMSIAEAGHWSRAGVDSCRAHLAHQLALAVLWEDRATRTDGMNWPTPPTAQRCKHHEAPGSCPVDGCENDEPTDWGSDRG